MVLNTKFAVPIVLGFSLVAVTALVVYYVFKKDEENEKETKSQIKTSRMNVIEVSIPKSIVPALIGKSGSNIKDIEKKSGASINFKKFSDKDYDICIIRGRNDTTQLAETLIHDFLNNQPIIEEEKMTVPAWSCGRIIGSGGSNINDISQRSGARVKIDSHNYGDKATTRQVTIRGTKEQIHNAKILVENYVSQEKCRREIEASKRSPRRLTNEAPTQSSGDTNLQRHATTRQSDVTGAPIEVYVSAVSSPARFWVQLVGKQMTQLDQLVDGMTEYYGNKDNKKMHELTEVSVGQVVAAVFRHDGRWYRARVDAVKANEYDATQQVADVFYLDYGDSEYVATRELCELRPDLLSLRFQAMECFLAGVRPKDVVQEPGQRWETWANGAIERFEELTQVARWKSLVSKTCTYKKSVTGDDEKGKEIPGIKLYDVTEQGEVDIGAALVAEGWAEEIPPVTSTVTTAEVHTPTTPFGDLGSSRVLGMLSDRGDRATSLPRDQPNTTVTTKPTSTSLASGLETADKSTFDPKNLAYPHSNPNQHNGSSHDNFLFTERMHNENESVSNETLVPSPSPKLGKSQTEQIKANMNRIDSHHGNLEALSKAHVEHM